jgi:hypothetical protein
MRRLLQSLASGLVFTCAVGGEGSAADKPPTTFDEWLDQEETALIEDPARANLDRRASARQTQTTAMNSNTTSLVDQSSAADLLSVALNLAGLSSNLTQQDNESGDASSVSATTSAYALYSLVADHSPLDPTFYCADRSRGWRRLSFTIGYDNQQDPQNAGGIERAVIAGAKFLVLNGRDACDPHDAQLTSLFSAMKEAGTDRANLRNDVQDYLTQTVARREGRGPSEFLTAILTEQTFAAEYAKLTEADREAVRELVRKRIGSVVKLRGAIARTLMDVQSRPQMSVSFLSKSTDNGPDAYSGSLIYDRGMGEAFNFTANATFEARHDPMADDAYGGRGAASLQYRFGIGGLELSDATAVYTGRDPVTASISGEASWMTETLPVYKGQAKLTIPLVEGITLPISVTVANRSELIDESEVRGNVGFSVDTSRVFASASTLLGRSD